MDKIIFALLPLIAQVESAGNNQAVGDSGRAIGKFQIWELYWKDGTDYLGVNWPYSEAQDPQKAEKVVKAYLTRYGNHYQKTTGKKATMEILASIHCAGPDGWKQMNEPKVKAYINKIKKAGEK